jgi:hypothetical protein
LIKEAFRSNLDQNAGLIKLVQTNIARASRQLAARAGEKLRMRAGDGPRPIVT